MHFLKGQYDMAGAGRWDKATGRYVPMNGGSRSRLPVMTDEAKIPRYYGFVGIDERLSETVNTMAALYQHIGGAPEVASGNAGTLTSRIQNIVEEQRIAEEQAAAAAAKAEKMAALKSAE